MDINKTVTAHCKQAKARVFIIWLSRNLT